MLTVLHSYSFRHYPLDHIIGVAAASGWPAIEISGWHLTGDDPGSDVAAAVRASRRRGVDVHCVGYTGDFAAADDAAWLASIDRVGRIIDACSANGVRLINGFAGWLMRDLLEWDDWHADGSALATDEHYERTADAYRRVSGYAAERGVRVAIEVHPHTVHDTVAATARLLKLVDSDNLGVTLDPGNAAMLSNADRDPEVVSLVADRVAYFHLKNCLIRDGLTDFTIDAANGIIDNYRWLETVTAIPGIDAVCVEYCGDGDPHPRVAAAREYLDTTLRFISSSRQRAA
jgi:3-dehydroshikimate dehydratase